MKSVTKGNVRRAVCFAINCKKETEKFQNIKVLSRLMTTIRVTTLVRTIYLLKISKKEVLKKTLFKPVHIHNAGLIKIVCLYDTVKYKIITVKSLSAAGRTRQHKHLSIRAFQVCPAADNDFAICRTARVDKCFCCQADV